MSGLLLWVFCAPMAAPALAVQSAYAGQVEYEVKAAFIHNFAKFIEWPTEVFQDSAAPIQMGYLGDGPINEALMKLNGKEVQQRTLKVSRIENINHVNSFHIIFVNPSQKKWSRSILASLRGTGILTIGDIPGFAANCGVVNFYLEKSRVRFEINVSAAERESLKVSSKLLRLARIVKSECH